MRIKQLSYLLLLSPLFALAQSTNQNYVKKVVYRQPVTTAIAAPTAAQANVSVTYFDGLGRPMQQVAHRQSATGMDIVTPITYDKFGRQALDYLPHAAQTATMAFDPSAVSKVQAYYNTAAYGNTTNPYSEKRLEASPLGRLLEQGAPGADWALDTLSDSDHTIKFGYHTNGASEVKLFKATATWHPTNQMYTIALANATGTTFYQASQLYKTVTRDENWSPVPAGSRKGTTEEFKNKKGQVVLKRTYGNNVAHDTYYVYDQFDNLAYVIPPLATGSISATKLASLCYQYRYDSRNRLVEKKLPGKQWEFIAYDKLDRVVATGPALSPFGNFTAPSNVGWLMTKYDAFNRPVLTAWKQAAISSTARKNLQVLHDGATPEATSEKRAATATTINGVAFRYTNNAEPKAAYHVLTINYYDDYDFTDDQSWVPSALPAESLADPVYYNRTIKPKGLATGSWVRVLEASTNYRNECSYILYDRKARPVLDCKKNHLGGNDLRHTKYDFEGKVLQARTVHKRMASSTALAVDEYFTYTVQGRLLEHRHKVDNGPEELLARNEYDDLGQLKSKRVGGAASPAATGLQKVDYSYNIRGWLKGINDVTHLANDIDNPDDLFAFRLNYNTVENTVGGTVGPLYNGNISETFWRTGTDNIPRKYGYIYDDLNRLSEAIYQKPDFNFPASDLVTDAYDEQVQYDRNGNITRMIRTGYLDNNVGNSYEIDNLAYTYDGNQLQIVTDGTNSIDGFKDGQNPLGAGSPDYGYDASGNMEYDWNKGITGITYNHMNLPTVIRFGTDGLKKIDYLYNALGVKLRKLVDDHSVDPTIYQETDYLGGFQYLGGELQFFPTAEGYVSVTAGSLFNYVYNYTDHLGNIRLSYTKPQGGDITVLEENHYYPFGMKHINYGSQKNKYVLNPDKTPMFAVLQPVERSDYQYKYNGKEYQDELSLNWYDYQARNYDPAIGRWMNIDPLAEQYRRWSLYSYCVDNPVRFTDPDGMSVDTEIFNTSGKKIGQDANGIDGTVSIIADNDKASEIQKKYKKDGVSSTEDVQSGIQTTKVVLKEALDVLDRTIKNGGDKEERSIVTADGSIQRGATGSADTSVVDGETVVKSSSMVIPKGEGNTSIHSHITKISGNVHDGLKASTSTERGPGDPSSFKNYSLNIIVGNLGMPKINVDATNNKTQSDPKQGAVFYNSQGPALLQLNKSVIEKIIK